MDIKKLFCGLGIIYAAFLSALICTSRGPTSQAQKISLEEYVLTPIGALNAEQFRIRQSQLRLPARLMLWGGEGKVTTGTSVDGRRTVPGLHTDCVPGELHSDCSPAQEDGAWSTDAEKFLDSRTGGAHSKSMQAIQADVDAGYAAREKFLNDCLKDASLCTGRRTDSRSSTNARFSMLSLFSLFSLLRIISFNSRDPQSKILDFDFPALRFAFAVSQLECRAIMAMHRRGARGRTRGLRSRALITDSTITTAAGPIPPFRRAPKVVAAVATRQRPYSTPGSGGVGWGEVGGVEEEEFRLPACVLAVVVGETAIQRDEREMRE